MPQEAAPFSKEIAMVYWIARCFGRIFTIWILIVRDFFKKRK